MNRRRGRGGKRNESPSGSPPTSSARVTVKPTKKLNQSKSVLRLTELAASILAEAECLFREGMLVDLGKRVGRLNVGEGIDFYEEVTGFEVDLIKLALVQTKGHQARAAHLLRLKASTLNAKIKQYGIVT